MSEALTSRSPQDAGTGDLAHRRAELDELRERVMNVVGHALRTPMATLRGHVEVIVRNPERITDEAFRGALVRSAQRLESLLDDLLVAAGIETRLPAGRREPLDLIDELEQVAAVEADRGALDLEITGEPGVQVRLSRDGLQWILLHLVRNARAYGGPRIRAHVETGGGRVTLYLRSPDADVADDELRHAFEMFYRGEQAVMAEATGLGVGLPVARRLAEHAGGSIHLQRGPDGVGVEAVLEVPAP